MNLSFVKQQERITENEKRNEELIPVYRYIVGFIIFDGTSRDDLLTTKRLSSSTLILSVSINRMKSKVGWESFFLRTH